MMAPCPDPYIMADDNTLPLPRLAKRLVDLRIEKILVRPIGDLVLAHTFDGVRQRIDAGIRRNRR